MAAITHDERKTNERPGVRAVHRHARFSAYKAREVLDLIRGLPVADARNVLEFCERGAADTVAKLLDSAVANAANNNDIPPEELFVAACFADEGPTLKRWRPRARGRADADPQAHLSHHDHRESLLAARSSPPGGPAPRRKGSSTPRSQRGPCPPCGPQPCSGLRGRLADRGRLGRRRSAERGGSPGGRARRGRDRRDRGGRVRRDRELAETAADDDDAQRRRRQRGGSPGGRARRGRDRRDRGGRVRRDRRRHRRPTTPTTEKDD